ncbi:MAG TPA: saccharopine dehydrogenase NADP-binding domain-containing protein [Kofleriaceae bacterium]|nr:saccharopine dehydrogenase NADP-binding domain-containing protein [Kofleriaceae bacterium]
MSSPDRIIVVGANGLVGQRVVGELVRAGAPIALAVRKPRPLDGIDAPVHAIEIADESSLARAFAGASVVINCAGPLRDTAAPVLVAAMTAGAHYVDVGGEQTVLSAIMQRHESTARKAGLVAVPGAGLDCVVGDLAAAWAAEHLLGAVDEGEAVRSEPAPRLTEDQPFDEVTVSYVFDELALSAGSQRALFGAAFERPLIWRRDRWEPGRAGDHRAINAGPALGGQRDAIAYAAGDALTVPRHVAAQLVATYASTTRRAATAGALRLLARALPLVPRAASELLAPYAAPDTDYTRTQFAVVAQTRRSFAAAQLVVRGHDVYRTTAAITAWIARTIAMRGAGPVGMRAPGELFRAAPALREIASAAGLTIEPSFGS